MVILGVDAQKRTHTIVAVDHNGRRLASRTIGTATANHLALLVWAKASVNSSSGPSRTVGICRGGWSVTCWRPEIVRVPPKLMAGARTAARTFGKSDSIDALAVARAALREPDLPTARLDGPDRNVRLLVDYGESLAAERTRVINRLRWHLHEFDPSWEPAPPQPRPSKRV